MIYRCVATSLAGFVQQVATAYLPHGYWFYSQGFVPMGKNPEAVDTKLITKYGAALSKWQRARRKRAGIANIQYLRFGRTFLVMATKGLHPFFEEEAAAIRDTRKVPIRIGGYSISVRKGPDGRLHSHVRIDRDPYTQLMAHYLAHGARQSTARLVDELYRLPYEPYAPVRRQYLLLLRRRSASRMVGKPSPWKRCPCDAESSNLLKRTPAIQNGRPRGRLFLRGFERRDDFRRGLPDSVEGGFKQFGVSLVELDIIAGCRAALKANGS